jgi:hypothetical protein
MASIGAMAIIVICPSRGRPQKAKEGYEAFLSTKTRDDSKMVFVVDNDDDAFGEYVSEAMVPIVTYKHEGGGMGPPLNAAVADLAHHYDIVGFVGDDHRFRTKGWDEAIEQCLAQRPGFAFGNDLARNDIPTQVFVTSKVVLALGWMCLPGAKHLYLDNTWAELGGRAHCLSYLPNVVIEHVHPAYGKAQMDEGYVRVNSAEMYGHDAAVFRQWIESGDVDRDVLTVTRALS